MGSANDIGPIAPRENPLVSGIARRYLFQEQVLFQAGIREARSVFHEPLSGPTVGLPRHHAGRDVGKPLARSR
jgi:hypothetical protein